MPRITFDQPAACDVVLFVVRHRPGITEAELAEALYGVRDESRVHQNCDVLEARGLIRRNRDTRPLRLYPFESK